MSLIISAILMLAILAVPFVLIALIIWAIIYANNKKNKEKMIREYHNTTYNSYRRIEYNDDIKTRGLYGEIEIRDQLKKYVPYGYRYLHNLYLPKEDGTTTEIDILFLTTKGFFVIESKNYSGYIFGRENEKYWTQSLNKYTKEQFYNPILQNKTHIKYLKKQLNKDIPIYSLIVFSDKCELKNVPGPKGNTCIIKINSVNSAIEYILNRCQDVLTRGEMDEIQRHLFTFSQKSQAEQQQHIDNIKRDYKKTNNINNIDYENTIDDEKLRNALLEFRTQKAREDRRPPYYVFKNDELEKIIKTKPKTISELSKVLKPVKVKVYGEEIVKIVKEI